MTHDDLSLLESLQKGEAHALGWLYRKFGPVLTSYARNMLKDEAEAQDQVQHLFIDFWEKKHYLQVHTSLQYYLIRIIHNRCLIHIQKTKVRNKRARQYLESLSWYSETDLLLEKESAHKVRSLINRLPVQRQEVFTLIHMEDKKYREAAMMLDISTNSVKTHLKLAVKQLRRELARAG